MPVAFIVYTVHIPEMINTDMWKIVAKLLENYIMRNQRIYEISVDRLQKECLQFLI